MPCFHRSRLNAIHGAWCDLPTTSDALDSCFVASSDSAAPESSADLLGERDEDALRTKDITEPIAVVLLHQFAPIRHRGRGAGQRHQRCLPPKNDSTYAPTWFGGALIRSTLSVVGLRNFVSSTRPWPSGVRIIAMSDRTPSSPIRRSTERPSTCASPSNSRPSSLKEGDRRGRCPRVRRVPSTSQECDFASNGETVWLC
jgi:hypothetical protein